MTGALSPGTGKSHEARRRSGTALYEAEVLAGDALAVLIDIFERLLADERLAASTGFTPGTPLVHLLRLRIASGKPVAVEETYTSETEVPGITPEIAVSGTYRHIEQTLGMEILTSKRTLSMRRADVQDGELLNLDPMTYIALVESHTFASTGNQFEVIYSRQHPEFFSARILATRPHRKRP